MRLMPGQRSAVVAVLGTTQTIGFASTYYLPAVLATPMSAAMGASPVLVFTAFSMAMVVSATVGPRVGARIDRLGGRGTLVLSNLVTATGLFMLAAAHGYSSLFVGWAIIGLGMGMGLYEAAFATLAGIYGREARGPITGITLIAGFASTVGWPLTGLMLAEWGWREACLGWAVVHICIALPLHLILPKGNAGLGEAPRTDLDGPAPPPQTIFLLSFVFAATWFNSTAMATHLPGLLEAAGASTASALAAGAMIGPAQVAARFLEFGLLRRFHPLATTRLAAMAHPAAAFGLLALGSPAAFGFAILHGAGNGVLTIAKGTLPLALFGPVGYGQRLGWLNAPARVAQAAAPIVFGTALTFWGVSAIWVTALIGLMSALALFLLRRT